MRGLRLSTLLLASNVGLLLLAVAGVAIVAVRLLQQLADEQAIARVTQANQIAQQLIGDAQDDLATAAQLLSERPTLRRLVETGDDAALQAFLDQFQATSQLDGIIVQRGDTIIVASGPALPESLIRDRAERFIIANGPLLAGARESIPELADTTVAVVQQFDADFARQLDEEIGLPVTILTRGAIRSSTSPPRAALRMRAYDSQTLVAEHLPTDGASYIAVAPLRAPDGVVVGVVETELPATGITRSVQSFVTTLLLLAIAVAVVAGGMSLVLGQRLVRPLHDLTLAAARIGQGDLHSPIPRVSGAEPGTLAATLEEMRWRLLRLTENLRRQQAEAQAIVSGIVEGVFSVDRERRIRYLNPQAAAMLGVEPHAAIGAFCGDVLNARDEHGARPCADRCPIVHARFRGSARATEHLLLADGRRRTVVITSAPVVDDMQVQVMRDETDIEAARRLRDTILANISHEFRTPLSAQLASIELLLDQLPDLAVEQIEQLARSQQRGTLRLTQLIDNLLESARIEAGQFTIRQEPVALDEVVEEAIEIVRPLLDQREQTVEVDLPYPLPVICGDARRLTQVFVNLLGNANKFAPAGTGIVIAGTLTHGVIRVSVEDAGPGLPAGIGDGRFGRFMRAAGDEPEQSGVGLGLWLTKSIIERHGGRLDAHTTARGARIDLTLPVEQRHEDPDR